MHGMSHEPHVYDDGYHYIILRMFKTIGHNTTFHSHIQNTFTNAEKKKKQNI